MKRIRKQKFNKSQSHLHHNKSFKSKLYSRSHNSSEKEFRIKDFSAAKLYLHQLKTKSGKDDDDHYENINIESVKAEIDNDPNINPKTKVNKFLSFMHKKYMTQRNI